MAKEKDDKVLESVLLEIEKQFDYYYKTWSRNYEKRRIFWICKTYLYKT